MPTNKITDEQLQFALQAAGVGTWYIDYGTGAMKLDTVASELFGVPYRKTPYTYKDVLSTATSSKEREYIFTLLSNTARTDTSDIINFSYSIKGELHEAVKFVQLKGKRLYNNETISFFGTVQDITEENNKVIALKNSELRFRSLIEEAPVATCLFVGRELNIEVANPIMLDYWGKDSSVIGLPLAEALPELQGQPFLDILDNIFTTGITHNDTEAKVILNDNNGVSNIYYFDYTYKPLFDDNGDVYAIMDMAVDVTDKVLSRRKQLQSESRFTAIAEQSPIAIGVLKGREMIIEIGNDKIIEAWGKDKSIIGMPLEEALPEIVPQGFIKLLKNVYNTGETFYGYEVPATIKVNDVFQKRYFDFTYSALRDENNITEGILILASDVTSRVISIKKIEESEIKLRTIINSSPAAIAVFRGEDLILDVNNKAFLDIVGREKKVTGLPLLEIMPELKGQKSVDLINHVFNTGKMVHDYGRQISFLKNGAISNNYYNVSYTPLFDADGKVNAVLDVAIDVTDTIKARQAIEEAEVSLRGAIELAQLATWSLRPDTMTITFSERLMDWLGITKPEVPIEEVFNYVIEKDRERVKKAVNWSLQPESDGIFNEEYTIVNCITGRERILHAQAKVFFDGNKNDEWYTMLGAAQDITSQKQIQLALENEVQARTEELQRMNLELEKANVRLVSSNEELAQYAYVASHDLQEPLRKISIFSNILEERDSRGEFKSIISKIIRSSERMSLLIKDLLEFSRLLNPDIRFKETDIKKTVTAVISDFELKIEEKKAVVSIGELGVIEAVPLQMNQLFYNLIGNALKFVPDDRQPEIKVSCETCSVAVINKYITNPAENIRYYCFTISDNGIGIKEEYMKQIFEVFKRLHSRDQYSGSGIGLAICKRIVANHKGAIDIVSKPGVGTSFKIILPEKQYKA